MGTAKGGEPMGMVPFPWAPGMLLPSGTVRQQYPRENLSLRDQAYKGRNADRPWLVMTSDREGEAGSRGKRVCYLKSVNPQVSRADPGTALK